MIVAIFLIFACGGGGGGGDEFLATPISYTGLKTPAIITSVNAENLADGMLNYDADPFDLSGLLTVYASKTTATTSLPSNISLSQLTVNALREIDIANSTYLPGAIATFSETQQCDSGTLYLTANIDTVTGEFDGYASYNDCVISGWYMDGVADFYGIGSIDPVTSEFDFIQMTMTFTDMNEIYGTENYTYSGTLDIIETSPTSIQITYDQMVRDNNTENVFMYADYRILLTDMVSEVIMALNGKFYDPTEGYVDVASNVNLHIINDEDWPYIGSIIATGDSSSFLLDCEGDDETTYTLSVDENGDGFYEISTTESW